VLRIIRILLNKHVLDLVFFVLKIQLAWTRFLVKAINDRKYEVSFHVFLFNTTHIERVTMLMIQ